MDGQRRQGMQWPLLWIYSAGTTAAGVLMLYLGPYILPLGKGFAPSPFLGQAPLVLMAIGVLGIVVSSAATFRSRWRESTSSVRIGPSGGRVADAGAVSALIVAGLALVIVILAEFVWPAIASNMRGGPCDQDPTVVCFSAHPDYYQETAPGGYSTPVSRIGDNIVTPAVLAAWPLALAAALVGAVAVVRDTRRRRVAILGMILGSLTVVWMGAGYLAFLVFGGGD